MESQRIDRLPLIIPITTKLTAHDHQALLDRAKLEKTSQTALIRIAVREFLCEPLEKAAGIF